MKVIDFLFFFRNCGRQLTERLPELAVGILEYTDLSLQAARSHLPLDQSRG